MISAPLATVVKLERPDHIIKKSVGGLRAITEDAVRLLLFGIAHGRPKQIKSDFRGLRRILYLARENAARLLVRLRGLRVVERLGQEQELDPQMLQQIFGRLIRK